MAATTDRHPAMFLRREFSPGLRDAIKEAIAHPSQAAVLHTSEIQEIYDRGVERGRELQYADERHTDFLSSFACYSLGAVMWGAIGYLAGCGYRLWF